MAFNQTVDNFTADTKCYMINLELNFKASLAVMTIKHRVDQKVSGKMSLLPSLLTWNFIFL